MNFLRIRRGRFGSSLWEIEVMGMKEFTFIFVTSILVGISPLLMKWLIDWIRLVIGG